MEALPRVMRAHDLARAGWTPARIRTELRRDRWQRVAPGILLTRPDIPRRIDWVEVGALLGGPGAVLSGWDALRRVGLGSPSAPTTPVLVLIAPGRAHRVVGGVRLRPSRRPLETRTIRLDEFGERRMLIASPARALADAAATMHRADRVRALATAAVQRRLATPAQLAAELSASPRNGSRLLRIALADVTAGAHSVAEGDAVRALTAVGVDGFLVNAPIHDAAGRLRYRADILWPRLRAILEIDSREFHFAEADWQRTLQRHNELTRLGYAVTHYPPSAVTGRGRAWAGEVATWLTARKRELGLA